MNFDAQPLFHEMCPGEYSIPDPQPCFCLNRDVSVCVLEPRPAPSTPSTFQKLCQRSRRGQTEVNHTFTAFPDEKYLILGERPESITRKE